MVINSAELSAPRLDKALQTLARSAEMGHIEARSTCGRLFEAFRYPSPIPRDVEICWLLDASKQGSSTAQERLHALDRKIFEHAIEESQFGYRIVCPKLVEALNKQSQSAMESKNPFEVLFGRIHCFASTGDTKYLLGLSNVPKSVYNLVNCLGETPLLVACRHGHATTAAFFLERGSDPRILTNDGVSALHFLSAFDDTHIPKLATLLLAHGAELDRVSGSALIYKEMFDSLFGVVEGTPLLWAVAARNACATKVLVDKGANPFKRKQNPSGTHVPGLEISPIGWGAMFHQHQLLEILLSSAKTHTQHLNLQKLLNSSFTRSHNSLTTTLNIAIDSNPGLRFREYLIHGKDISQITVKCIQLLLKHGATPISRDSQRRDDHPIMIACLSGNVATLEYLWSYKNGSLRPTPKLWSIAFQHVIFHRHRPIFDFLIEHRGDIASDRAIDEEAIRNCFAVTNDQHFVMMSLKLIAKPTSKDLSSDYADLFEFAITTGQLEAAELLFQNGSIHLTRRFSNSTIIGNIILVSSKFPNMEQKVAFVLSLIRDKNELFWNVSYLDECGLTALQAIVFSSTNGGRMNGGVFSIILQHFNDPQYLNSQMKGATHQRYTGFTALHLAVECGNANAVTMLLHNAAVNTNLLTSHGLSPADICVAHEREYTRRAKFRQHSSAANHERQNNLEILRDLISHRGRISKFFDILQLPKQEYHEVENTVTRIQDVFSAGMVFH